MDKFWTISNIFHTQNILADVFINHKSFEAVYFKAFCNFAETCLVFRKNENSFSLVHIATKKRYITFGYTELSQSLDLR